MNWTDVLADPSLQDLPYKIELNSYGQIVMTPASNRHARFQAEISILLGELRTSGSISTECSISTKEGVKVADVTWISKQFSEQHGEETPFAAAPELCVDVVSPSNTLKELHGKMQLYFEQGAHEVWFCNEEGELEFFSPTSSLAKSQLFPGFPSQIG